MPTTTTTTNPHPDIPLPAGTHALGGWEDERRTISTDAKGVDTTDFLVSAVATQLRDGSINIEPEDHDVPLVFVDELDKDGMSRERLTIGIEGARGLARALLEAAAELDGWATR